MSTRVRIFTAVISLLIIMAVILIGLGNTLGPLFFAFGLAYLLFPLIRRFEAFGCKRHYAVIGIFSVILAVVALVVVLVLPSVLKETKNFVEELPANYNNAIHKIEKFSERAGYPIDISHWDFKDMVKEHAKHVSGDTVKNVSKTITAALKNTWTWILSILNLFLIPLFFFFLIDDYEKITGELKSFVPLKWRSHSERYYALINTVLSGYIRGQLLVAMILGILYGIGLASIGLRFGFIIGLATGLMSIIPYAGFLFGFLTALMVAIANYTGVDLIAGVIIVFLVVQLLESLVITPRLVGNKVGLSTFTTMLVLIIGGNLFGLLGMLLAIPIAAIVKVVIVELKQEYLEHVG